MPELCRFMGLVITMYHDDHPPPHFHATYGDHEAHVLFDGTILAGQLPPRQRRLIRRWAQLHRMELEQSWHRALRREPLGTIEPLS
jgi:hypothetical protein